MNTTPANSIDSIVQLLLQVGERVVEVSRDQVMTRIWDREGSPLSKFRSHYEGKKISEIRNDTTIIRAQADIEKAFATGQGSYQEYVSYKNDVDTVLRLSFRILTCHPDKDFVFLVIENISRGSEDLLVEDKWKLALDASGQGVWDANLENKTIFFSHTWEQLFGYDAKEITSFAEWSAKIHPEDLPESEHRMRDYAEGRTDRYNSEVRYRCKDGSYKWILSRGVIVSRKPDGTPLRFIGTHVDIDDRKKAEQELKQAKETFANSFNYSGIGKALIEPGGRWLEVNDVVCEMSGYTREELLRMHYRDITFPEDMDIDVPLIQKLLAKEIPSYSIGKRYVSKDRKVLSTLISVTLVWDIEDKPKYFICDIIDNTKQNEISEELKRKNSELETTSENLRSRIHQVEELNHIIAHNLRGPAGNIKMIAENADLFPEGEVLPMIHKASESLLASLEMLTEVARIKLNKKIEYDNCNVREMVNELGRQMQGVIFQNKVSLILSLDVEEIRYPRVYLESILYNLVSNAIKYHREKVEPAVEVITKKTDKGVQLAVKDNGLGIDLQKYGSKVFKLNHVFHAGYDSKGVGLFITKTQIESLGGTIEVKSQPNQGCEFIVNF